MKSMEGRNLREAGTSEVAAPMSASRFEGLMAAGGLLDKIVEAKATRILKSEASQGSEMSRVDRAVTRLGADAFLEAITASGRVNVVAEIKRRSPSKGVIRTDFDPIRIADSYRRGGAAALSVLTEEDFFDGSLDFLRAIRSVAPEVLLLRKDFIFAESQVHESKAAGADALLLITAILRDDLLARLIALADKIGIAPLVEVHSAPEMEKALAAGATIIGVNNRDLTDFTVRLDTSFELAAMAKPGVTLISESGLSTGYDIARLRDAGYSAFLVGEHLMRAPDPGRALTQLITDTQASGRV